MAKRKRADAPSDVAAAVTPGPNKTKKAKASPAATVAAVPVGNGKQGSKNKIKKTAAAAAAAPTPTPTPTPTATPGQPVTIQIVTGSYDRILHGITATVAPPPSEGAAKAGNGNGNGNGGGVEFADTFLFNAHSSAIRCLALSPPSAPEPDRPQKVMLAPGSSDERINVYNISAHPPKRPQPRHGGGEGDEDGRGGTGKSGTTTPAAPPSMNEVLSSIAPRRILEDPRNRELGTLLHHSAAVTRLAFPTRSKLLSASEDCTVAVTRTRDWALLSSIRAPAPKPQPGGGGGGGGGGAGYARPSGDTAAPGTEPRGVADFAVHPSMKLMITVGRGERCMRLWNLMTAKKAGVLNFGRDVLAQAGEGRHALGEGRRVVWGVTAGDRGRGADGSKSGEQHEEEEVEEEVEEEEEEDEFCVEFDRDLLVFGMDSTPKCRVMRDHRRKVHAVRYVVADPRSGAALLAVSTEDGRIMFFSTRSADLTAAPAPAPAPAAGKQDGSDKRKGPAQQQLPVARLVAQLGGKEDGVTGRIKDFTVLRVPSPQGDQFIIPAGSSDGQVRMFAVAAEELNSARKEAKKEEAPTTPPTASPALRPSS